MQHKNEPILSVQAPPEQGQLATHASLPDAVTNDGSPQHGAVQPTLSPIQGMDTACFRRLLETAGPTMTAELLLRLKSDLMAVTQALNNGFATKDWPALSRQSHNLIGLSGVVGATALLQNAQILNTAAAAKDIGKTDTLQASMMTQLADLIDFVTQYPHPLAKLP